MRRFWKWHLFIMEYLNMRKQTERGLRPVPAVVPYHRVLVSDRLRIGRDILALALLIGGLFFFSLLSPIIGGVIDTHVFGRVNPMSGGTDFTPVYVAGNFVGVAALIPWSMFLQRWLYGVKGATLHSVRSVFRFDVFGRAMLIIVPIWTVYMVFFNWFSSYNTTEFRVADLLAIFAVSVLLGPLQSAGEEYGFRGLVFRIASSWVRNPRASLIVGIAVSSVLFALVHVSTDPWFNLYYLALGIAFATITWRTGGLENAIVIHAVNNTLAYIFVLILRVEYLTAIDRSAGMGSKIMLMPCAVLVFVTMIIWFSTRLTGPERTPQNMASVKAHTTQ
ncbi:CAAX amino terminal protease family protein (plasmid) [Shinella sp. WSC3-e]|nr:CAAX amino terminal protease family protein [Shinella sp. WSC3-e]